MRNMEQEQEQEEEMTVARRFRRGHSESVRERAA